MKHIKTIIAALLVIFAAISASAAVTGTINSVVFNSYSMNRTLIRPNDNGIFLHNSGICMEGTITFNIKGCAGKRLICCIFPIREESYLQDDKGDLCCMYGFTPRTANYTGSVNFEIPMTWLGIDPFDQKSMNQALLSSVLLVSIIDPTAETPVAEDLIALDKENFKFDKDKTFSSMLGGMFGGGVSGDFINNCAACDGTGICNYCDGDGFFNPRACRKCINHPGICRRCDGKGEEGTTIQRGLFDLF